jgi:hypothetical protein
VSSSLVKLLVRSPQGIILPCFFLACDKRTNLAFLYMFAEGIEQVLFMVNVLLILLQTLINQYFKRPLFPVMEFSMQSVIALTSENRSLYEHLSK